MANNQYINKVVNGESGDVLIDLTADTITASSLMQGYTAHDKSGAPIVGTATGGTPSLQSKTATPSTSQQTITADSGYDGLSSVTVSAMPTGTAGTPTATKVVDTTDASALITPSVTNTTGYISGGTKTGTPFYVTAGELVSGNTLTADDSGNWDVTELAMLVIPEASQYVGIVSNEFFNDGNTRKWHVRGCADIDTTEGDSPGWVGEGAKYSDYLVYNAVPANTTITPSTLPKTIGGANYMMEGAVTVSAMPTGTAGTPTATKGSVSNHAISVTPSVTNTTGYITGGTKTGTAVTVSASELVSGSETKTANGTYDVTNLASLVVNVTSSSKNVQVAQSTTRATSTSYTEVVTLTCSAAGTYDVYWSTFRTSTSGTWGSQLYINDSAYGSAQTGSWSNHIQNIHLTGVQIAANQEVSVRVRSRGSNYYGYVGTLTIVQTD